MISLRLLSFLGSLVTVSSIFVCLKAHNEINVEDFRASDEVAAQAIEMFQSLNIDLDKDFAGDVDKKIKSLDYFKSKYFFGAQSIRQVNLGATNSFFIFGFSKPNCQLNSFGFDYELSFFVPRAQKDIQVTNNELERILKAYSIAQKVVKNKSLSLIKASEVALVQLPGKTKELASANYVLVVKKGAEFEKLYFDELADILDEAVAKELVLLIEELKSQRYSIESFEYNSANNQLVLGELDFFSLQVPVGEELLELKEMIFHMPNGLMPRTLCTFLAIVENDIVQAKEWNLNLQTLHAIFPLMKDCKDIEAQKVLTSYVNKLVGQFVKALNAVPSATIEDAVKKSFNKLVSSQDLKKLLASVKSMTARKVTEADVKKELEKMPE